MSKRWFGGPVRGAAFAFGLLAAGAVMAQVSPPMEYGKYVQNGRSIQALGDSPFGENVSLYDGGLSFRQVDFELPGTGPTIKIVRSLGVRLDGIASHTSGIGFQDWELDLPSIRTMAANHVSGTRTVVGWQIDYAPPGYPERFKRCTYFSPPPELAYDGDNFAPHWAPEEWWNGYQIVDMDGASQTLLQKDYGSSYPLNTNGHWRIACLPTTANGEAGEAFLAVDPSGTKYWLNYLVYVPAPTMDKNLEGSYISSGGVALKAGKRRTLPPTPSIAAESRPLGRFFATMLVTRIEDRFGNFLTYKYDAGKLRFIEGSDGRHVTINYNTEGRISAIASDGGNLPPRTWTYQYGPSWSPWGISGSYVTVLTAVVNPDQSRWEFDLGPISAAQPLRPGPGMCSSLGQLSDVRTLVGTLKTPSGLTGTFKLTPRQHGRSYVWKECWGNDPDTPDSGYAYDPRSWYSYTIDSRSVTGPGIPLQTWQYAYSPPNESWYQDCIPQQSCVSTVWTDVTDPDGDRTRHIFSNKADESETLRLRSEVYAAGASTPAQVTLLKYPAATDHWTFQQDIVLGHSVLTRGNQNLTGFVPLVRKEIQQDGATFVWQANAFDARARVLSSSASSSLGFTKSDTTEYRDNTTSWVMGQVQRSTTNGIETMRADYDAGTDLPIATYQFNKLQQTVGYWPSGLLKTITDPRGNTTTFSDWKLGIPGRTTHADGATEIAGINDYGWIDWITNAAGSRTCYAYDAMGRVIRITQPSETAPTSDVCNEDNWNRTDRTFAQMTQAKMGLTAGFWKETVTTGRALATTYYDAMWRPVVSETSDLDDPATLSQTVKRYDADGKVAFASYPTQGVSDFQQAVPGVRTLYDVLGRPTRTLQDSEWGVLTTQVDYLAGFKRKTTNPRQQSVTESFQVYDTPTYDAPVRIDLPENARTTIARDAFGKPLEISRGPGT